MRIRTLKLENYRGFLEATLDLDRPLTVLVGLNGSGKSSILTAIATACSRVVADSQAPKRGMHWRCEDVDVRVGATELAVTAQIANGAVEQPVQISHRRGQANDGTAMHRWGLFAAAPFLLVFYIATRSVAHGNAAFQAGSPSKSSPAEHDFFDSLNPSESGQDRVAFGSMFRWFKDREDIENETRVTQRDLTLEDPQLAAVRRAVAGMLPGFTDLRMQRDPLHMIVRKGSEALAIDQLSDGEKLLLAMTAELARQLATAYPSAEDPLEQEALVLIDEIELHLHVGWQRTALVNLRKTFPGCQFIVTTHSPQVLSTVPGEAVLVLDQFQVVHPGVKTDGRDSNSILREIFDIDERPQAEKKRLREVDDALDRGDLEDARREIADLEDRYGGLDVEVIRLKTRLEFLEMPLQG